VPLVIEDRVQSLQLRRIRAELGLDMVGLDVDHGAVVACSRDFGLPASLARAGCYRR